MTWLDKGMKAREKYEYFKKIDEIFDTNIGKVMIENKGGNLYEETIDKIRDDIGKIIRFMKENNIRAYILRVRGRILADNEEILELAEEFKRHGVEFCLVRG